MTSHLIIDTNYLCYRAFYSTPDLSHEGVATGTLFGVFNAINNLTDRFQPDRLVFCFDFGQSLRERRFPGYKKSRREKRAAATFEEKRAYKTFMQQVDGLRMLHLHHIGYSNVLYHEGFESDDIIASVTQNLPVGDTAVMVSADKDLYQLLRPGIEFFNPQKQELINRRAFREEWGLNPQYWSEIKALAGCGTDDIPGINGVGERTAAKYLRDDMKPSLTYKNIKDFIGSPAHKLNQRLVTLPYPRTPVYTLRDDEKTPRRWAKVMKKLGMYSLMT